VDVQPGQGRLDEVLGRGVVTRRQQPRRAQQPLALGADVVGELRVPGRRSHVGEWFGFGPTTEYDGRTFYDNERNDGYPVLAVRLEDGRFLQLQYPTSAGFSQQEMIRYLDGVVVNPGACQGTC
jgi:hypothetical protein